MMKRKLLSSIVDSLIFLLFLFIGVREKKKKKKGGRKKEKRKKEKKGVFFVVFIFQFTSFFSFEYNRSLLLLCFN